MRRQKREQESLAKQIGELTARLRAMQVGTPSVYGPRPNPDDPRLAPVRRRGKVSRRWGGETHTVYVSADGREFTYRGKVYRSLSAVAREITGWPSAAAGGYEFFGL